MLIDIVSRNAAQLLLNKAKQSNHSHIGWGALHFACSKLSMQPVEDKLLLAIRSLIGDKKATLYLFDDGDIVITCQGAQGAIIDALSKMLYTYFDVPASTALHHYFDSQAQGEELRTLCRQKLGQKADDKNSAIPSAGSTLSGKQISTFRSAAKHRGNRRQLEILIVEDQVFSAQLLAGLLNRIARTHVAPNAEKAWELYQAHAPDVAFLDIEMPGMNGHELAAAIHKLDNSAYMIMVTANNQIEDVSRAKLNGAKGFVVKPYSKQKILEGVEKYITERKLKH